jgi:hypothetical protein
VSFEISMDTGPLEAWIGKKPKQIHGAMRRAIRRTGTSVQRDAIEMFRQRGVGRRIFGQKPSGARKLIGRGKLRVRPDELEQPIVFKGLAALQERGGRTKAHGIKPKNKRMLRFFLSGKPIFALSVRHPGGTLPAIPVAAKAAERNRGTLRAEMNKELAKALAEKT